MTYTPTPLRLVFFGTPDVAVYAFEALVADARFELVGVVTQPPRPRGRSKAPVPSPVHRAALDANVPVHTPERADEIAPLLNEQSIDAFVVVAYGQILSPRLLAIPRLGALNLHPSLLPRWRGPSPVPAAILAGDETTGVSLMLLDDKMDHGPLLDVQHTDVDNKTTSALLAELMRMGARRLPDVLAAFATGDIAPQPQDHDEATYCKFLKKEAARIDWNEDSMRLERRVRAYDPWPGTWTEAMLGGVWRRTHIRRAHRETPHTPCTQAHENAWCIAHGIVHMNDLIIDELQLDGKPPVEGVVFAKTRKEISVPVR